MGKAGASTHSDEFAQRSKNFVEWFRNAPGTRLSDKIELADLRDRGAGRGVVATQDIAEDEELFAVPRNLVLTTSTTGYTPPTAIPEPGTWLPLIIITVQQLLRKEASAWYPYFQVLPSSFDTLMHWDDAEVAELQASPVLKKIGRAYADKTFREKAWAFMSTDLESFNFDGDGKDEWQQHAVRLCHYAGSLIMAYAFDIDRHESDNDEEQSTFDPDDLQSDDEDNPLKGLVPFADMLNADADRNNARLFQEDDYLVMKAIKPIKAGRECFNDYGPLPRSELLRMYGYVTDTYKQYDVVDFEHDLLEKVAGNKAKSKAWEQRKDQLDEIGVLDDGYTFSRPGPDDKLEDAVPGELHMVLRGLCTDPDAKMNTKELLTVEEAALLSSAAIKKLSEFPTSLEQDKGLNKAQAPSNVSPKRYEMAIEVRIGEKEILHQILELCEDFVSTKANDKKRRHPNGDALAAAKVTKHKHKKTKT